jgi:hypothetical protein
MDGTLKRMGWLFSSEISRNATLLALSGVVALGISLPVAEGHAQARQLKLTREVLQEPPRPIKRAGNAMAASDGTLYLVDAYSPSTIFVFPARGESVTTIGRQGKGPGEFERIDKMGFVGDTIWVTDLSLDRLTYITAAGKVLRTEAGKSRLTSTNAGRYTPIYGVLADGSFIVEHGTFDDNRKSTGRFWFRATPTGNNPPFAPRFLDTLAFDPPARHPMPELMNPDRSITFFGQPFGDDPITVVSPTGMVVNLSREAAADAKAMYVVSGRSAKGELFKRTISYTAKPLTPADLDAMWKLVDTREKLTSHYPSEAAARRVFEAKIFKPTYLPPVREVVVGADNSIWIQRELGQHSDRWDVLSDRGEQLGWVDLAHSFTVKTVSRDAVWGVEQDQDGQEIFVRYRISK